MRLGSGQKAPGPQPAVWGCVLRLMVTMRGAGGKPLAIRMNARYRADTLSASYRCPSSTLGYFNILTPPLTHPPAVRLGETQ